MPSQTYDDGSSLTWSDDYGFVSATPGIDWQVNKQSASWDAKAVQPAAGDWGDVLKYGFARLIDAKVRPVQPSNTTAVLQPAGASAGPRAAVGNMLSWPWIIVGAVVLAVVFLGKKSA